MIQPEDIRRKADDLYGDFLQAWLAGDQTFFPRVLRAGKTPPGDDPAGAIQAMRRLREGSKEVLGYGYTVEWREINSRRFGRNPFPDRILIETQDDLLRLTRKKQEFLVLTDAVERLRRAFPELKAWVRGNGRRLLEVADDLDGLLAVLRFFRDRPRPGCFARELPLPVGTKFVGDHQALLREWFDRVLPPHAIRADEEHFERRYGLRYAEPHLPVRLLDEPLQRELGFPCAEFSLPPGALDALPVRQASAYVVENKVNLLTFPPRLRGIGLGGLGGGVTLLRHVRWLAETPLVYWGDLDVEGFQILSALRGVYPHVVSLLMDPATLERWRASCIRGTGRFADPPPHLTDAERAAFLLCRDANLRLEQELIPPAAVVEALAS